MSIEGLKTHGPDACSGEHCCVHNPSKHHMRDWPLHWRGDRYMMERICPHGVGHPDPDHMADAYRRRPEVADAEGIHGCDFCCRPGWTVL